MSYFLKSVTLRTDNSAEGMAKVAELWGDVVGGKLPLIFNSAGGSRAGVLPVSVYENYQSDETGAFDLSIAIADAAFFVDLDAKTARGEYVKYEICDDAGDLGACARRAWEAVWADTRAGNIRRAYTVDYESSVPPACTKDGAAQCCLYIAVFPKTVGTRRPMGTRVLQSGRLILRPFSAEDARAVYDNWASDARVTPFLTWKPHRDIEETRAILGEWAANYRNPDYYNWAIELKELGQPIGSISVVETEAEACGAQVGYCLGSKWWHRGIMSEALGAALDYLFREVGFLRVEAMHDVRNPHSGGVMKKCGMRYEGTLRGAKRNNLGICDVCVYAMLASDRRASEEAGGR